MEQRWATEERQREARRAEELKHLEVEREKIAAEKERAAEERKALEAAQAAEIEGLLAAQKECMEERARRLLAKQQVQALSQAADTFSPSVLSPPPTHTPFDLTFKSPVARPPPCNTPRRSTPSVVVPTAHRWIPVSCLPATTHEVNYAFLSSGPAYSSDFASSSVTHTVPSLPPVALSFEPLPSVPVIKAQPVVPPLIVNPSTLPAPVVTQPQVVLVKQFQPPKPYSGASSWKGYREYFERLATANGWTTTEQKTEQLALALEGPASEVLRDLDTSQPQAYSLIWEALARRFGSLDGAREPCAALTLGARRRTRQFQIRTSFPYLTPRDLACRCRRTAGCSSETPFRGRVDFY